MGIEGAGSLERLGPEVDFSYRKFIENGQKNAVLGLCQIKIQLAKHASLCGLFCHTTDVMYGAGLTSA